MLVFECPSCKTKMQAAEEHAGKTTVCPSCGAKSAIPAPPGGDAITADPDIVSSAAPKPDAITTPDQARTGKKDRDDYDDDVRRPRRRDRGDAGAGTAAAVGMSVGMIVLIVVGIVGCVGIGVVGLLVALLVPAVSKVREAAARTQTMNNMKQVAIAFHAYHDANKKFPSQQFLSPQGMKHVDLSWRVTLLPYVEQQFLLQQIDQTNGWNQGNNPQFAHRRPKVYEHVLRPEVAQTETVFQVFAGPKTLFPTPQTNLRMVDVVDGTSNTFLFAEAQTPVPWLKPADMTMPDNGALPLPKDRFLAAMADGTVRQIDRGKTGDVVLRALIDPRDGAALPPDF